MSWTINFRLKITFRDKNFKSHETTYIWRDHTCGVKFSQNVNKSILWNGSYNICMKFSPDVSEAVLRNGNYNICLTYSHLGCEFSPDMNEIVLRNESYNISLTYSHPWCEIFPDVNESVLSFFFLVNVCFESWIDVV